VTSRADGLQQIEQELAKLIRRARRVIRERAREVHPELQPSTYLMLGHIREHGPLRPASMCASFDIDKAAISRQVQHLLELGLVDRTQDPEDGRATLLRLSDEGSRRMADVAAHRRKDLDERLADWSADDLVGFADELARYNATLSQD
jgi:DNA-binding MarR family transcriptional regulator